MFWTIVGAILFAFIGIPIIFTGIILLTKYLLRKVEERKISPKSDNIKPFETESVVETRKIKNKKIAEIFNILESLVAVGFAAVIIIFASSTSKYIEIGNTPVTYNDLTFTITQQNLGNEMSEKKGSFKDDFRFNSETYKTVGTFTKIILSVDNIKLKETRKDISEVKLRDNKGREYTPRDIPFINVFDSSGNLVRVDRVSTNIVVKPGIKEKIAFIFEVPVDYSGGYLTFKIK